MPKIEKVLVIAVLKITSYARNLKTKWRDCSPSLECKASRATWSYHLAKRTDGGELKERIKEGDFDCVLVIRPMTVRKETGGGGHQRLRPYFVPPAPYYHFWPYWNMAWGQVHTTNTYLKKNTIVNPEFNLYNTKDEKLLWSGETETVYSKDFGKLAKAYAKTLVKQLKKDKVVGTK